MTYGDDFDRVKGITAAQKEEDFGTVEPVVEEKQDMIDFELLEDDKAAQHIDHDIEEIVEASAALEGYIQVMKQNPYDGISKQTAQAMLVGLTRIDKLVGQKSELVAALEAEAFDNPRIGQEKSSVDKEGLAGRAKQLWAKFKELILQAVAKAKALWQKITDENKQTAEKAEDLKDNARQNHSGPNGPKGGRKVTLSPQLAFFAAREGKQLTTATYQPLATFVFDKMAAHVQAGIDALTKGIIDADLEAVKAAGQGETPEFEGELDNINITGLAEGGWSVEIGEPQGEETVQVRDLSTFIKTMGEINSFGNYLAQNSSKVFKLAEQLNAMLSEAGKQADAVDAEVLHAVLNTVTKLKSQQEAVMRAYGFVSRANTSLLSAAGKEM